ncbi:MAG: cell division protein [Alphaproteobacteria bacterium]|nr:cell division protein [Alphaproteobacteria bacterium]
MKFNLFNKRTDLPLGKDETGVFFPLMTMLMVFLACLSLAGAMSIDVMLDRWSHSVSGSLTIQIMPDATAVDTGRKVDLALSVVRATDGVQSAEALKKGRLMELLEPWLGQSELLDDLPLPQLIDVTLEPGQVVNLEKLEAQLSSQVKGVTLDNHRIWLEKIMSLGESLKIVATFIVFLVVIATSATVIYSTRTSLAVHRSVIEVLHFIGAHDDYIARQFADRVLMLALVGGVIGVALALPTTIFVGVLAQKLEGGIVAEVGLEARHWFYLCLVPIITSLMAMFTARLTVLKTLRRMV